MPCPKYLKEAFRRAVNYTCEQCHKREDLVGQLQVHRMIRGNNGGKYVPHNCKIICEKCHKLIHGREFK